jgi:hypothetical protein
MMQKKTSHRLTRGDNLTRKERIDIAMPFLPRTIVFPAQEARPEMSVGKLARLPQALAVTAQEEKR